MLFVSYLFFVKSDQNSLVNSRSAVSLPSDRVKLFVSIFMLSWVTSASGIRVVLIFSSASPQWSIFTHFPNFFQAFSMKPMFIYNNTSLDYFLMCLTILSSNLHYIHLVGSSFCRSSCCSCFVSNFFFLTSTPLLSSSSAQALTCRLSLFLSICQLRNASWTLIWAFWCPSLWAWRSAS